MLLACLAQHSWAQSFLSDLRKAKAGEGTVVVSQNSELDELVNKACLTSAAGSPQGGAMSEASVVAPTAAKRDINTPTAAKTAKDATAANAVNASSAANASSAVNASSAAKTVATKEAAAAKEATSGPQILQGTKVDGYRVQVFSGGNTRDDRSKAEAIGREMKALLPDTPIYVHFYSPRWICRVGNYRQRSEADAVLKTIKAAGYKEACIVKGKITVVD